MARTASQPVTDEAGACCATVVEAPLAEDDAVGLAATYAALGDPVRLRLLSLVVGAGELCSCELTEPLDRSQPTVSHHTKVLAEAGLITGERRGRWVYWSVPADRRSFVEQVLRP